MLSWVNVKVPESDDYIEFMLYPTLPAPDKRGGKHHLASRCLTWKKPRPL